MHNPALTTRVLLGNCASRPMCYPDTLKRLRRLYQPLAPLSNRTRNRNSTIIAGLRLPTSFNLPVFLVGLCYHEDYAFVMGQLTHENATFDPYCSGIGAVRSEVGAWDGRWSIMEHRTNVQQIRQSEPDGGDDDGR